MLDYLVENIKCYQGKYQEDGSMLVTPLITNIVRYSIQPISYLNGEEIDIVASYNDYFTILPTIYYRSEEVEPDKFQMKFSVYPFDGCHKVFGEDTLIGTCSGYHFNNHFYANNNMTLAGHSFSESRKGIDDRGEGYYGFTSDEMGVLMFLNIYDDGVNGDVLSMKSCYFLGVTNVFVNGHDGRMYPPNIEIDNLVAKVTHLDGNVEYLELPYIWEQNFNKLHIGEYLTILPKEVGDGIYRCEKSCWGDNSGVAIYLPTFNRWSICYDRNNENSSKVVLKIRPCFKGKIVETTNVEYFKSVPIIN